MVISAQYDSVKATAPMATDCTAIPRVSTLRPPIRSTMKPTGVVANAEANAYAVITKPIAV